LIGAISSTVDNQTTTDVNACHEPQQNEQFNRGLIEQKRPPVAKSASDNGLFSGQPTYKQTFCDELDKSCSKLAV